ncbi:hypothetical protein M2323_004645 [Rhodoblastus acidophilus]|uniref:hypothetical protein n=1 Tax=Rhodoblastus acidophilus TaxID=1074 RepID=UPI002225713C|nr:hypothetical protein [Rhodoblastus acidophilus]MCW2286649.1 hypothetical protein [Rhodoblastus acidophilus]MCW2335693.1 hypothetical protein [Rhodoblastus acidophilus]
MDFYEYLWEEIKDFINNLVIGIGYRLTILGILTIIACIAIVDPDDAWNELENI